MNYPHIVVSVAKGLEGLIPTYMANRAREVSTLRTLLAAHDMEQLARIGHQMREVGAPYGFEKVSAFGKLIEDGAKAGDYPGLERCLDNYAEYLTQVRIDYG